MFSLWFAVNKTCRTSLIWCLKLGVISSHLLLVLFKILPWEHEHIHTRRGMTNWRRWSSSNGINSRLSSCSQLKTLRNATKSTFTLLSLFLVLFLFGKLPYPDFNVWAADSQQEKTCLSFGSCSVLSLADYQLSQVRLREAPQLLQRVVLRHRQTGDVGRQLGDWDAEGVRRSIALLQAQHHTQDVGHTLRHFCKEGGGAGGGAWLDQSKDFVLWNICRIWFSADNSWLHPLTQLYEPCHPGWSHTNDETCWRMKPQSKLSTVSFHYSASTMTLYKSLQRIHYLL